MIKALRTWFAALGVVGGGLILASFGHSSPAGDPGSTGPGSPKTGVLEPMGHSFPYKKGGLNEEQAAAHLLSRFSYGAEPGQVDAVVHMGLEKWFRKQLAGDLPEDSLNVLLAGYDGLKLSNGEIVLEYPNGGELLRMARKDGFINTDSLRPDRKEYRQALDSFMKVRGLRPQQELLTQFYAQKVLRAAYANNQLEEVMTDFWFNHFNVSVTKGDCVPFIPDYERDVIRPNALGKFSDLLLATAKSPAMLYYLDNFTSSAPNFVPKQGQNPKRGSGGLNENYAREVMELHTLGVDGGYNQHDVTEAARVLTGWTVYPLRKLDNPMAVEAAQRAFDNNVKKGFVHDGDFLFNANRHDKGEKVVMGRHFGPDGGYQEGVDLLEMLAHHASTAHFICKKIAVRFVCDDPPASLLDKMVKTFLKKDGDIREVLITMVSAPEFWSAQAVREKIKSPFELAISAVRSLQARIYKPDALFGWVTRMGERLYGYQAPTGFPDKGQYWINTGALLNRMNFGLAIASGRVPGVSVDLFALNMHHEPESAQAALVTYSAILMPGRNLDESIKRLTPMLNDPDLAKKVEAAEAKANPPLAMNRPGPGGAGGTAAAHAMVDAGNPAMASNQLENMSAGPEYGNGNGNESADSVGLATRRKGKKKRRDDIDMVHNSSYTVEAMNGAMATNNHPMLAQVVGIIIGSPEFQRR